jgi:thymidylate synthase ThyX
MWITGVSRNLSHELVRHHVGFSPSQRSTRYVDERDSAVVDHPEVGWMSAQWNEKQRAFEQAWRALYACTVDELIEDGYPRKTAQGAAARYLPNGIETRLTWSGNAAAFLSMIQRRGKADVVDAEFVELVGEMLKIMKVEMPVYFKHVEVG